MDAVHGPGFLMVTEKESDEPGLREFIDAIKRRRLLATLTTAAAFALVLVVTLLWPTKYRASATILIEQQEIPQDMVRSTITSFADQRIQVISQQVMTTSNLLRIIDQYGLYPHMVDTSAREEILEEMRGDTRLDMISAEVVDPRSGRPTSATIAFTIAYLGRTPDQALKVANELSSLFLQKNVESRTETASETSEFLASEAARLNDQIGVLEDRLSEFKAENLGSLPELNQLNMNLLDRSEREIKDIERQLRAIDERIIYLQSEVAARAEAQAIYTETGERIYSPQDRLKYLESQLASYESLYSDKHPDVVRARREIAGLKETLGESVDETSGNQSDLLALKAKRAALAGRLADWHPDVRELDQRIAGLEADASRGFRQDGSDPALVQLETQLQAATAERRSLERLRDEVGATITGYEARLAATPLIEKDYVALTLDLENARQKYRDVKAREMEARLSQNMESDRKGERLTMIEPPLPPEQPASPDRPLWLTLGAIFSVAIGIGTAVVAEMTDTSIRGREMIEVLAGVPALGFIPVIETRDDQRRRRRFRVASGVTAVVLAMAGALLVHAFLMPLDVLWYASLRRLAL